VQHFAETPGFFGPLVVLAFAVLLLRWILARRCGTMDIVATLCIITLAIGEPLKGWLKFIFGRTWPAYGHPSFIFEGAYGFLPFHGGPDLFSWSQRDNRGFSRTRTSSATAPRLPDANQDSLLPLVRRGISRFPRNELLHMPGSSTTSGRPGTCVAVPVRVAFRLRNGVGAQGMNLYEAQWLAYALPYRRFAAALTDCNARLGADVDRYSLIVSELHRLLVAGLPAHCEKFWTLPAWLSSLLLRILIALGPAQLKSA
jgi:hypothetical protein